MDAAAIVAPVSNEKSRFPVRESSAKKMFNSLPKTTRDRMECRPPMKLSVRGAC
jgi:hypothetical protein